MFTKKHFELLAEIIGHEYGSALWAEHDDAIPALGAIYRRVVAMLQANSARFDVERFNAAVLDAAATFNAGKRPEFLDFDVIRIRATRNAAQATENAETLRDALRPVVERYKARKARG